MRKFLVSVTVDTNDADYLTQNTEVSEKWEHWDVLRTVAAAIKNFNQTNKNPNAHNWNIQEHSRDPEPKDLYKELTEEEIEIFEDWLCPCGGHGFHTVESIDVIEIVSTEKLL